VNRVPWRRYLAAAAAVAAAGAAAGCGSSAPAPAASPGVGTSRTGTVVLSGSLAGRAALADSPAIPVRLTGLVHASATVHLRSAGQNPVTFVTRQGNLAVRHTEGTASQRLLSAKTCRFAFAQHSAYTVLPRQSTGTFRGATGRGTAVITFTGTLPRKGSQCDTSSSARPSTAGLRVSFAARGPLTVH
jgi:hypothetical protein